MNGISTLEKKNHCSRLKKVKTNSSSLQEGDLHQLRWWWWRSFCIIHEQFQLLKLPLMLVQAGPLLKVRHPAERISREEDTQRGWLAGLSYSIVSDVVGSGGRILFMFDRAATAPSTPTNLLPLGGWWGWPVVCWRAECKFTWTFKRCKFNAAQSSLAQFADFMQKVPGMQSESLLIRRIKVISLWNLLKPFKNLLVIIGSQIDRWSTAEAGCRWKALPRANLANSNPPLIEF